MYAAIVGVGIFAGFINTLAGSGSLLTLPLLMFLGLPPNVANGTNRIAILLQNVVGVSSFKQQKVLKIKDGLQLGIPAVIGSLVGARINTLGCGWSENFKSCKIGSKNAMVFPVPV